MRHLKKSELLIREEDMQTNVYFPMNGVLRGYFIDGEGLIDTVSNKHIATFLGMMPVTLSRLRRELQENGLDADRASDLPSDAPCGGIIGEKGVISLILTCALLVGMCWCGRSRHTSARSRRSGTARLR